MIYVITETAVKKYTSIRKLKNDLSIQEHELTQVGKDHVINLTDEGFEVAKDVKLLEAVASKRVFTKESMDLTNWLQILTIIVIYFMTKK
jgi:hypothetical protein